MMHIRKIHEFSAPPLLQTDNELLVSKMKKKKEIWGNSLSSLRSWRDFVRECFCFGSEAVNASGEAVRGLVKSRVEFPPAQISGVF